MVKRKSKYPRLNISKEDIHELQPWDYGGSRRNKNDMHLSVDEQSANDKESTSDGENNVDMHLGASRFTDCNPFMKFPNWNTIPDNLTRLEDLLFEVEIIRCSDEPDGDMDILYKDHLKDKGVLCIAGFGRFKIYGDFFKQIESLQHSIFTVQINDRRRLADDVARKSNLDYDIIPVTCNLVLTIYIHKPGDPTWGQPSHCIKHIFDLMFHPLHSPQSSTHSSPRPLKPNIEALYCAVKEKHALSTDNNNLPIQHVSLIPSLRLYQRQALQWMLRREVPEPEPESDPEPEQDEIPSSKQSYVRRRCLCKHHATYTEIITECGTCIYYNIGDGSLKADRPTPLKLPTGGILADEMGLGKTVEVLALILANPRNLQPDEMEPDSQANTTISVQPNDLAELMEYKHSIVKEECLQPIFSEEVQGHLPECTKSAVSLGKEDNLPEYMKLEVGEIESKNLPECTISEIIEEVVRSNLPECASEGSEGDGVECTVSAVIEDVVRGNFEAIIEDVVRAGASGEGRGKRKAQKKMKVKKLSLLKQASVRFYNSQLEMMTKKPKLNFEVAEGPQVVCLCGAPAKGCMLKCSTCGTLQHAKCVGVEEAEFQQTYYCPQCWQNKDLLVSGTTLIVSPATICDQWVTEVKKHISDPNFKMYVYSGVNKNGFEQPTDLAKYDIVITTYETLRNELKFAFINQTIAHRFRSKKRFVAPPSPLVCLQWWRVCLDEAQMAQGTTTQIGRMARTLHAVHRWAVTGTPLHRSIEELFGIVDFLGLEIYSEPRMWRCLISDPYRSDIHEPLHRLMAKIMWRTAKQDVLDQIHIPAQTEETHWVHFSPVEQHFYRTEHESSTLHFHVHAGLAADRSATLLATRLSAIDRSLLCSIMRPLRYVRQACTHLQLRWKLSGLVPSNQMLTMEEVLEQMIKKTANEGDEALREHIAAINGLAAIHIIDKEWLQAVEQYRSVLHLIEDYKDQLTVDKLQTIHTLHNLADVLDGKHPGIPPTLRDDSLRDEATQLETKYMGRHEQQLAAGFQQLEELTASVPANPTTWWADLLVWVYAKGHVEELTRRLEEVYPQPQTNETQTHLLDHVDRQIELEKWTGLLLRYRDGARLAMTELHEKAHTPIMAVQAANCHLSQSSPLFYGRTTNGINRSPTSTPKCSICKVEDLLQKYEVCLFAIREATFQHSTVGDTVVFGKLTEGTWQATDQETCLKVLHTVGRSKKADEQWLAEGAAHFKFLESLKKEFRRQRSVWTQLRDTVAARDELHMCRMRLRLIQPDEPRADLVANRHILDPFAVPWHRQTLKADRSRSESIVKRKIGIQQYLKNLRKNSEHQEPCPVCRAELNDKWSVLQCGHVFCLDCIKNLGVKTVTCALCREPTHAYNVSYVYAAFQREDGQAVLVGSHSSKVCAILRCLLKLRDKDPQVKVLVFSTWDVVLDVLAQAMTQNKVSFARLPGKNFQQNVRLFKTDPTITALLLPLRSGSKGLNLTEASHIILVEPILNPGDELQALGRLHRFGQTKQTVVHRFLVFGTIEERIYRAVSSNATHWEEDTVTLGNLYELFQDGVEQATD